MLSRFQQLVTSDEPEMLSGARAVVGVAVDLVCVVAVYLPCLILDLIGEQKPQHITFTDPSSETLCIPC